MCVDMWTCLRVSGHQALKVREHNILGPYVDGLSLLAVTSFEVRLMLCAALQAVCVPCCVMCYTFAWILDTYFFNVSLKAGVAGCYLYDVDNAWSL